MDRAIVKKTPLEKEDEAFCLSLSLDERIRVVEGFDRQGRLMAGDPASAEICRAWRAGVVTVKRK